MEIFSDGKNDNACLNKNKVLELSIFMKIHLKHSQYLSDILDTLPAAWSVTVPSEDTSRIRDSERITRDMQSMFHMIITFRCDIIPIKK